MYTIAKIRAEIERRYNKHKYSTAITEMVYAEEDEQILSFLDTLEEPVCEELDGEINRYINDERSKPTHEYGWNVDDIWKCARHFAKWGAEHFREVTKMMETPKDLEEAAEKYLDKLFGKGKHQPFYKELFIAGAKWQEKKDQETIKLAEDHAFLAGADWQKEQGIR